jgi:hypothetical protein
VKTCMLRKRSQLSAACRSAMAAGHRGVRHREYHHRGRRHHHG